MVSPIDENLTTAKRREILSEEEKEELSRYLSGYHSELDDLFEQVEEDELTTEEFKDQIIWEITVPPQEFDPYDFAHDEALTLEITSEFRRYVYENLDQEQLRDDLLHDWWMWSHYESTLVEEDEIGLGQGFASEMPTDSENTVKAKQVVDEYDDFAFSNYD